MIAYVQTTITEPGYTSTDTNTITPTCPTTSTTITTTITTTTTPDPTPDPSPDPAAPTRPPQCNPADAGFGGGCSTNCICDTATDGGARCVDHLGSLLSCGTDDDCAPNEFCDAYLGNICNSGDGCTSTYLPGASKRAVRAVERDLVDVFKRAAVKNRVVRQKKYM
jgi:hypothetical protein